MTGIFCPEHYEELVRHEGAWRCPAEGCEFSVTDEELDEWLYGME